MRLSIRTETRRLTFLWAAGDTTATIKLVMTGINTKMEACFLSVGVSSRCSLHHQMGICLKMQHFRSASPGDSPGEDIRHHRDVDTASFTVLASHWDGTLNFH